MHCVLSPLTGFQGQACVCQATCGKYSRKIFTCSRRPMEMMLRFTCANNQTKYRVRVRLMVMFYDFACLRIFAQTGRSKNIQKTSAPPIRTFICYFQQSLKMFRRIVFRFYIRFKLICTDY